MIGFESIFEKCLHLGELCNDSRLYKNVCKVLTFENISFESVGVFGRCFEDGCEQATMNILPTQKGLSSFPPPLDVVILPLIDKNPYHWM